MSRFLPWPRTPSLLAVFSLLVLPSRGESAEGSPAVSAKGKATGATAIATAAVLAAVAQAPLQAVEPAIASADAKVQLAKAGSFLSRRTPVDVLLIGDSMTVGGFGESLQAYLYRKYGANRVALYASCGSSPEHWLRDEPAYVTKCGYKEQTPTRHLYFEFENSRPPRPTATPKLENLLDLHQPSTVIVQLGTNWMDALENKNFTTERPKYAILLDRFAVALRASKSVKKVIWISPPDSSRYSGGTKRNVDALIRAAAKQHNFEVITSANMTHYVAGKTGGDGVHYKKEDAYAWAGQVQRELRSKLR